MTYKVFQRILEAGMGAGTFSTSTAQSIDWFRQKAESTKVTPQSIIRTAPRKVDKPDSLVGRMMLFSYDPLHARTLPYYDRYPLVFPIDIKSDGFTGINMHYLPHSYRAMLMDGLYQVGLTEDGTQIQVTYEILQAFSRLKYFRPCFKRYLNTQVKSRFVVLEPEEWNIALFLPLERFAKATKTVAQSESLKKVANG